MLTNIIDRRRNVYRAADLNVVLEPSWPISAMPDADQHPVIENGLTVRVRKRVSLPDAIDWADGFGEAVTLFLYDADNDPMRIVVRLKCDGSIEYIEPRSR